MTERSLRARVAKLEAELAELKTKVPEKTAKKDWIDIIAGSFAHDPIYEEAMRLGREWRQSFRPRPTEKKNRRMRQSRSN
jgi:hypothetical protein